MTAAPPYNRQFNFSNYQAVNPATPLPGNNLDIELNQIKVTLDAMLQNTALIQRSDGALANGIVGPYQISPSLSVGFNFRGVWQSGATYNAADGVSYGTKLYIALVPLVSLTSPDIDTTNWKVGADFAAIITDTAIVAYLAALPTYSGSGAAPVPTGGFFWNNGILMKAQ